jgi:hypothetical protein
LLIGGAAPPINNAESMRGMTAVPLRQSRHRYSREVVSADRKVADIGSVPVRDPEAAALQSRSKEQAELREKRLKVEENLRRKRVTVRDAGGKFAGSSPAKSRDSTLDSLGTASAKESATAAASEHNSGGDEEQNTFEERRVADADEDWVHLRARAEKEARKVGRSPRKARIRRPVGWPKAKAKAPPPPEKSVPS